MSHITVFLKEAVDALALTPQSTVFDATLGSAGHGRRICEQLGKRGHYIGVDADPAATTAATSILKGVAPKVSLVTANFTDLDTILQDLGVETVDGILADLGWRIEQFTDGGKGFSFRSDEPLLMTYGDPANYPFTAADMVNEWTETQLATVIKGYGEERYAGRIAHAIVTARREGTVATTAALAEIIMGAVPSSYRHGRIHPATRTFQALRMTVNDELTVVENLIHKGIPLLGPGGRMAIITFHSIEDRVVKHLFREYAAAGTVEILTKRPLTPTADEVNANPRARSAKLRIIKKTSA